MRHNEIGDKGTMRRRASRWDPQRISLELKRLRRAGEDICSRNLRRAHSALHAAAIHWFGNYRAAVEAAGIDYARICHEPENRWDREQIIRVLRKRRKQPLHQAAMEREMPALVIAAYRYFGNYRTAIEAAGLDYETIRIRPQRVWTQPRILKELRNARREGEGVWHGAMKRKRPTLLRAAQRYFGTYSRAAREAGIEPAALRPPPYRQWSPPRVLEELQRMHRRREPLNPTHLRSTRPYLFRVCGRRFGNYRKAVTAAGIEYTSVAKVLHRPMPAGEVVTRLQTLFERGKDLRYAPMTRCEPRLLEAARRRFGSYREAVIAAGIAYPPLQPLRHWTEPFVVKTLRELNRAGVDLRYANIKRCYQPLYQAARYYFGNYVNAVREAGIDYDRVVKTHLRRSRGRMPRGATAAR